MEKKIYSYPFTKRKETLNPDSIIRVVSINLQYLIQINSNFIHCVFKNSITCICVEYIVHQSNMELEYQEYEECVKNMINEVEKHVKEPAKAINDEDELTTVTSVILFCNYKSTYMYTVRTKNTAHQ